MGSLPKEVEEYFAKGRRKIKSVTPNEDFTLTLVFDNDEIRIYDMSKNMKGVLSCLKDMSKFKEVFLDETGNIAWDIDNTIDSSVHWSNRIDLCSDSVYIYSIPISDFDVAYTKLTPSER